MKFSFRQFVEGKGMLLGQSAEQFVNNAAKYLKREIKVKHKLGIPIPGGNIERMPEKAFKSKQLHDLLIYRDNVDTPYGSRNIKIYVYWCEGVNAYAYVDYDCILVALNKNDPEMTPEEGVTWREVLRHELVHMFDPKFNIPMGGWRKTIDWEDYRDNPLYDMGKASDRKKAADDEQYVYRRQPTEEDANMAAKAYKRIKYIISPQQLTSIQPVDPYEKQWYSDSRAWRKYLNTIYALYQQKNQPVQQ
jgi:hypothetical protein